MSKLLATIVLIVGIYFTATWLLQGVFFQPSLVPPGWWGFAIAPEGAFVASQENLTAGNGLVAFDTAPLTQIKQIVTGGVARTSHTPRRENY